MSSTRIDRTIFLQQMVLYSSIVLAPVLSFYGVEAMFPALTGAYFWLAVSSLIILLAHTINFISSVVIIMIVYGRDTDALRDDMMLLANEMDDELQDDTQIQSTVDLVFTIVDTSEVLGFFKDAEFYSWVDLEDKSGTKLRAVFDGTMNMQYPFPIPNDCILFMPGILYKIESSEQSAS